jgi:hypothetical protein
LKFDTVLTLADDCEKLVKILVDAPEEGLTQAALMFQAKWSARTVNSVLLALGKQVQSKRSRLKNVTAVRYSLRSQGDANG